MIYDYWCAKSTDSLYVNNTLSLSDAIVTQVLDELGLQMAEGLSDLPSASSTLGTKTEVPQPMAVTDTDDDIQSRLNKLRREWDFIGSFLYSGNIEKPVGPQLTRLRKILFNKI